MGEPQIVTTSTYQILIDGVHPFAITHRQALVALPSKKILQRLLHNARNAPTEDRWLRLIRVGKPGREALIEVKSFEEACERYRGGEEPPLLPSELRRNAARQNNLSGNKQHFNLRTSAQPPTTQKRAGGSPLFI